MVETIDFKTEVVEYADYQSSGSQTSIFLHGSPGDFLDLAAPARDRLLREGRFIAYNRPGFGQSRTKVSGPYSMAHHVDLLNRLFDYLKVESAILVAHSWAASLALEFALKHHERVDGLILLSPFAYPRDEDQSRAGLLKSFRWPLVGSFLLGLIAKTVARSAIEKNLTESAYPQRIDRGFLEAAVFRFSLPQTIQEVMEEKEALISSQTKDYREVLVPTAIIGCPKDKVISFEAQGLRLSKEISKSIVIVDEKMGHLASHLTEIKISKAIEFIHQSKGDTHHAKAQGL
jgi:pimeloyl-ACP methyl ester carboxylesterase